MPSLTIKGVPDELYRRLKRRAADHRRSINSEVLVCLEQAVASRPADPDVLLARIDALHARLGTRMRPLSSRAIRAARNAGRP